MQDISLTEKAKLQLQGCLSGYVTRQHLVLSLRRDYERVVTEVEDIEHKHLLPLANQTVVWPKTNTLCLPRFTCQQEDLSAAPVNEGADRDIEDTLSEHTVHTIGSEKHTVHIDVEQLSTDDPSHQAHTPPLTHTVDKGSAELLPELPKSKEGLIELRSQLSMELMWLKQAIVSRQSYLLYKDQLSPNNT